MILNKYILKNFLKVQFVILMILLLIFEFQQIIRVLNEVVEGNIPSDLIFQMSILGIPFMLQIILPLSLFLTILLVLSKLHAESEIIAMQACGAGKSVIFKPVIIMLLTTTIIASMNAFWISPFSLTKKDMILEEAKKNPQVTNIVKGKFIDFVDSNFILFTEDNKNSELTDVYIFQTDPYGKLKPSVLTAKKGSMEMTPDKTRILNLSDVFKYEGIINKTDFNLIKAKNIVAFLDYQLGQDLNDSLSKVSTIKLWRNKQNVNDRLELIWRLDLVIVCIIMGFIAVPLSYVEARQGKYAKILPAVLIFMIYFLGQNTIKRMSFDILFPKDVMMFLLNFVFILLGIMLNFRDSGFIRKRKQKMKSDD